MVSLRGNEPLEFDYGVAEDVKSRFSNAASDLEAQISARVSYTDYALEDFSGYFSTIFAENMRVARADLHEIADALDAIAQGIGDIIQAAREEDERRRVAREYITKHDDWWEKAWDWFVGQEAPPRMTPQPAPVIPIPVPRQDYRDTPRESSGYSGGTSSARPAHLRGAASGFRALDGEISGAPHFLMGALSDFSSCCRYGTLDGSGPVSAYRRWIELNGNDVEWLETLARTFEAAGSDAPMVRVANSVIAAALESVGIDVSRLDLHVEPASISGIEPTTGYAVDPVNVATGNFVESETDLSYQGLAELVSIRRTYNSVNPYIGVFGLGWYSILDERVETRDDAIIWYRDDGRETQFDELSTSIVRASRGDYWLETVTDGNVVCSYIITDNAGVRREFDASGKLREIKSGPGRSVTCERNDHGQVRVLRSANGREITVTYDGGLVSCVESASGSRVGYRYDNGLLATVITAEGERRYEWNEAGFISRVVSVSGVVEVENVYDADGRVVSQKTPFGRDIRFAYVPGRVTSVSDLNGERSDTWLSDKYGRLIRVVDSSGHEQRMVYDKNDHLIQVTERDGSTTYHMYDARGRRIRTVLPEGGEFTYSWDDLDRVTAVMTSAGGEIRYEYEGANRDPSIIRDAIGGVTYLEWVDGALLSIVDPENVRLVFEHDSFGDLARVSNATGSVTYDRDAEGRVIAITRPSGGITRNVYDGAGHVVQKIDSLGNVTQYEWEADRLKRIIAPDGGVTEMVYGSHGEVVETIDPSGRSVRRSFDDAGNVSQLLLPNGDSWSYSYDSLSRLTGVIDPEGKTWTHGYDPSGRLSLMVDPTGLSRKMMFERSKSKARVVISDQCVDYSFDPFGRVVSARACDDAESVIAYDCSGYPVEIVHADGSMTTIVRDRAGRVVRVKEPHLVTSYGYDNCGRVVHISCSDGRGVSLEYNSDSQVVKRSGSDGSYITFTYDAAGRLVEQYSTQRGRARFAYDSCGRVIRAWDGWSGSRSYTWDVAGQLVSVTNGLGGVTRFEYDELGRVVCVVAPDGGRCRRRFNAHGRIVQSDGPDGLTCSEYDEAGRLTGQSFADGVKITREFDSRGRVHKVFVNGNLAKQYEIDDRRRSVTLIDHYNGHQSYTLTYDSMGRVIAQECAGHLIHYHYLRSGMRDWMSLDGAKTHYEYDDHGRIMRITHPSLGDVGFTYSDVGLLSSITQGDYSHEWEYADGQIVVHRVIDDSGVISTRIERDQYGRIIRLTSGDSLSEYAYDDAGQLVKVVSRDASKSWVYDACGRITSADDNGYRRAFVYDEYGRLIATISDTERVMFEYDERGRRVRETGCLYSCEYEWNAFGFLTRMIEARDGKVHALDIHISPFGTPESAGDSTFVWELADQFHFPLRDNDADLLKLPGGMFSSDCGLSTTWRMNRSLSIDDPWSSHAQGSINESGHFQIHGIEWMTARAYDPRTYSFLSPDPLEPIYDRVWSGNAYHYAANNPLAFVDPLGLRPATDADLDAYVTQMPNSKWEYALAAVAIAGGVALMFTGVGGPVGLALLGASGALLGGGISIGTQKATTGTVDWSVVGKDSFVGLVTGVAGGGSGALASEFMERGATRIGAAMMAGTAEGSVSGAVSYSVSPGPHTVEGYLEAMSSDAIISGMTAGVMSSQPKWLRGTNLQAFKYRIYKAGYLDETMDLYRVGNAREPEGSWYTRQPYDSISRARQELALPDRWKENDPLNIYDACFHHRHGGGQPMYSGYAAPQSEPQSIETHQHVVTYPGGGHQIFLPDNRSYGGELVGSVYIAP